MSIVIFGGVPHPVIPQTFQTDYFFINWSYCELSYLTTDISPNIYQIYLIYVNI